MIDVRDAAPAPPAQPIPPAQSTPPSESPREWIEGLLARIPPAAALAVVEHRYGVLPLAGAFFEPRGWIEELAAGRKLGALGLFTPAPELRWGAPVEGEPAGKGLLLRGEVRIASPAADGTIVLARAGGEHRLAWLDHRAARIERRGSRKGGAVCDDAPCWLVLEGVAVGPDRVSRPLAALGGDLFRHLEAYAGVWAHAAAICAGHGVRALRRAARTTGRPGRAFSASQRVAMDITEVEIEAELTATAVRLGSEGLVAATAAARTLAAVVARTQELRDLAGLEIESPLDGPALTAFLGGPLMLENELGHALGIPEAQTQERA